MATVSISRESGLNIRVLSNAERDAEWKILSKDINPVGKKSMPQFTPKDKLKYFVVAEKSIGYEKVEVTLNILGREYKYKSDIYSQDVKEYALVRKVYGK